MATDSSGHRKRLRRSFVTNGLDGFEPHNALELLLTYCIPRKDTKPVAKRLLSEFGSFDKVLDASYENLLAVDGVGEATAAYIKLLPSAFRYYEKSRERKGFSASSPTDVINYVKSLFVGITHEQVYVICFDSSMKLINCAVVSEGTVDSTPISVRKIVETATACHASSVILAHNHPASAAMPSADDLAATKKIVQALSYIDIAFADHIIVGKKDALSMAQTSVLYNIKQELGV